jgi:hypothetical protein
MAVETIREVELFAKIWRWLWVSWPLAALLVLSLSSVSAAELKATDFALMDRLTWGVTPSSVEHIKVRSSCIRGARPACRRPFKHKSPLCQTSIHLRSTLPSPSTNKVEPPTR